jgi:hypothetical protein
MSWDIRGDTVGVVQPVPRDRIETREWCRGRWGRWWGSRQHAHLAIDTTSSMGRYTHGRR